jgi:hypothetical protein
MTICLMCYVFAVLWIRIRSDRHDFAGFEPASRPVDPDTDTYLFQPNVTVQYFFQKI